MIWTKTILPVAKVKVCREGYDLRLDHSVYRAHDENNTTTAISTTPSCKYIIYIGNMLCVSFDTLISQRGSVVSGQRLSFRVSIGF